MVRFGLCVNMDAKDRFGVGFDRIPVLKKLGFDYVELPLAQLLGMEEAAFEEEVLGRLEGTGIRCETCNNFFPADVRLTGTEVDLGQVGGYVERALRRAARVGAEVVVMGSAGARNLPGGMRLHDGYRQLAEALGVIGQIARGHGINVAIEPLNRLESNIVNSYQSGLYLAALSGQENVGTLVDAYHFLIGNEVMEDLWICPPIHVHYAELLGRRLPERVSSAGRAFFEALRACGYDGRISLEGYAGADFEKAAGTAIEMMRRGFV